MDSRFTYPVVCFLQRVYHLLFFYSDFYRIAQVDLHTLKRNVSSSSQTEAVASYPARTELRSTNTYPTLFCPIPTLPLISLA